jgi:hypothetical protein
MNFIPTTQHALDNIDMSNIDFEVIKQPVYSQRLSEWGVEPDYKPIENLYEYRRADNNRTLGVHTISYNHDGYSTHAKQVVEALKEMSNQDNLDTSNMKPINFEIFDGGRKMRLDVKFPNHNITIPAIGDIMHLRMRDWDSYDGSWGRKATLDAFRLWCLNGCTSSAFQLAFYAKHTKSIGSDEKTAQMISSMTNMLEAFNQDETKFIHWHNTAVSHDEAKQLFSKTIAFAPKSVKVNEEYFNHSVRTMESLDDLITSNYREVGGNLWGVYNAATAWSTHVGETKGQVHNVERTRESKVASMLNSDHWKRLERIAA